ncbi:energy-coupling factor transport system permease protein [Treponema bryantii]|uniref:Energy-coupling factor transport system permease protein n=1 Tax=Treponema bryantii TaxID=163 RepID=A0A1H9FJV4_9SPIR|nr:energy-coupling factor transporter transmembrane component T [Treponema bryantii]SEQ38194.1 energy-coupling factor transport system permease protein [Treponema bryantii]
MHKVNINPIVLIIINILAPTMYIFLRGTYLQYFLAAFALTVLILMGCFKIMFAFIGIYAVMQAVIILGIQFSSLSYLSLFFVVLIQSVPCFAMVFALIKRYTSAELLSALETMRIPRVLVVAVTITLKYVPTFSREFKYILESMRLRGISFTWLHPVKSFQYFIVPQLFRCAALSEEVTAAGLVKGIDAPVRRSSYFEQKFRFTDFVFLAIFAAGLAGGFIWFRK